MEMAVWRIILTLLASFLQVSCQGRSSDWNGHTISSTSVVRASSLTCTPLEFTFPARGHAVLAVAEATHSCLPNAGWFAARCDLILLLFDPHKLDISDEFKQARPSFCTIA